MHVFVTKSQKQPTCASVRDQLINCHIFFHWCGFNHDQRVRKSFRKYTGSTWMSFAQQQGRYYKYRPVSNQQGSGPNKSELSLELGLRKLLFARCSHFSFYTREGLGGSRQRSSGGRPLSWGEGIQKHFIFSNLYDLTGEYQQQIETILKYSRIAWDNKFVKFNQVAAIMKSDVHLYALIQNDSLPFHSLIYTRNWWQLQHGKRTRDLRGQDQGRGEINFHSIPFVADAIVLLVPLPSLTHLSSSIFHQPNTA